MTTRSYFEKCLYFTANSLSRAITRMADEEFSKLGMSTSHAFLLMLTIEKPGISQKDLAQQLNLAQSTVSRFVDSLAKRGLIERISSGKQAHIYPTSVGKKQLDTIQDSWKNLYQRYCKLLGEERAMQLILEAHSAHQQLLAEE